MLALFDGYTGLERFFGYCALFGGLFLVLRFLLQMMGFAGHDADTTSFDSNPADVGPVHDGHHGGDVGFKLVSVQGLTAFFLMFGLVGLALLRQSKTSATVAIAGATVAGLGMVWIMAQLFSMMKHLQSSGNIDIRKSLGSTGTVYVHIGENASGQVQVCIQDRLRIYDAVAGDKKEIKTGERIKVTDVISPGTLVVEKVD
jgi:hypothetical protein